MDLFCGKRCPDAPGNGDKDQISQPDIIGAETGPAFALSSSASATLSIDWMGDAEFSFYGQLAFWNP